MSNSLSTLYGFLLVLARVSGVLIFVPLPGLQTTPEAARVVLALALTFTLIEVWPTPDSREISPGRLSSRIAAEFGFGLMVGVAVSLLLRGVRMAGLQAGFSYASTLDPSSQADTGGLQVITQLVAGSLFLALGLDRQVIRILAYSLERLPSAAFLTTTSIAEAIIRVGSSVFVVGLRLALPVIALLALVDISFEIMGRIHSQLQLLAIR